MRDFDPLYLTYDISWGICVNGVKMARFADHLSIGTARFFKQYRYFAANHAFLNGALLLGQQALQLLQPNAHYLLWQLRFSAAGVPGRVEYLNEYACP